MPSRSPWQSVVGWVLIVIGVLGGLQNLSQPSPTLINAALFIALGVGLIRRWSVKRMAIIVASVLVIPAVIWFALSSSETNTNSKSIAELNRLGDRALGTRFRVSGDVTDLLRDGSGVHFTLVSTENSETSKLQVTYNGVEPLPDAFRAGSLALVDGKLSADRVFHASRVHTMARR
jgi:cytochrome c-type biogenesis protein CcmE